MTKVELSELTVVISADSKTISAIKTALTPEVDNVKNCRLSLGTDKSGRKLSLILRSEDIILLRAGLNTNLRLASSALKSINAAKRVVVLGNSEKD